MEPNGAQIASKGAEWTPHGAKWLVKEPNGAGWSQMEPDGAIWSLNC
jgi:hypothetical protein